MKPIFTVSKTYEVVTPESAEYGDVEDSGFIFRKEPMTLREVMRHIDNMSVIHNQPSWSGLSIYGEAVQDYRDGSETSETLHVSGPTRALRRLEKLLNKK